MSGTGARVEIPLETEIALGSIAGGLDGALAVMDEALNDIWGIHSRATEHDLLDRDTAVLLNHACKVDLEHIYKMLDAAKRLITLGYETAEAQLENV